MNVLTNVFSGSGTDDWNVSIAGNQFLLKDAPTAVTVTFYKNNAEVSAVSELTTGYYVRPDGGFDRIKISSAGAQTVKIIILNGDAGLFGGQATISGTVSVQFAAPQHVIVDSSAVVHTIVDQGATIADTAAVSVGTSATSLLAASAGRLSARFYNPGPTDVYLGGSGVTTANGCIKIGSGETWVETDAAAAAWYGIVASGTQSVRVQGVST